MYIQFTRLLKIDLLDLESEFNSKTFIDVRVSQAFQDWQVCLAFQEKMEPLDKRLVYFSLQPTCFPSCILAVHSVLIFKLKREDLHGQGEKQHMKKKNLKNVFQGNFFNFRGVGSCVILFTAGFFQPIKFPAQKEDH